MASPLRKTPSKENVPTANAHNIIEENTQLSNLNTTSDETNDNQPPILTNSLPTSTAPITSPPHEQTTKPHPQNIVMTSDKVTSNQIPLTENSVPTSPPPDNKLIQDEKQAKPHAPNIATSDEVTDNQAPLPTENSSSTSLTTSSPDDTCTQDEKQAKPHAPNIATSDKVTDNQAPLPTENSSSTSLTTSSPDDTCIQDEKQKKPHPPNIATSDKAPALLPTENSSSMSITTTLPPDDTCTQNKKQKKPHPSNLVTIINKPKAESSSVPSSQVNRDPLLTENLSVTTPPPDNKHTQDKESTKPCPQNLITSNKLDKGTDNSSVPSSPISLAKELLPLPTESTSPITIAHITSPSEYIPDIEHHDDDDPMDLPIQQHLQLEQDPLIADDHENLELEPIDIPSLIQPDNQPLLQLEPEFVYLTPAIQETGEDNMPPNVVVGSSPHLPHSMEDSLVYTCNTSYNTTSDHSSNNRELVHY